MDGYDEDITENPFYKAFLNKAKPLYSLAADNRWMICIPRKGTTARSHYINQQFETHVLKAIKDDSNHYETHNGKQVRIDGKFITTVNGFSDVKTVRVLFEETFFNPKEESYSFLCIDQPLEGGAFQSPSEPVIQNLETLQNCIDFLWNGTGSRRSRRKIDDVIDLFNSTYQRLETESVRHAMDAANAVFTRAMQTALKEQHLRRPALGSKAFMDNLKVAIESYVMHGLYKRTFKGLCSFLANEDAELNKITRNLADLQVKDLGVKQQLCKNIPRAKKILSNLNRFSTPLEKLYVLKLTVMTVSEVQDKSDAITADDLLPVLVFLVVKSEIPNWLANLTYMYNFHFSKSKNDEFQFYLSSIEAATEYVRSKRLNHLIGLSHAQRRDSLGKLFQRLDSTERTQGPSPVEILFEEIRNSNSETVHRMLSKGKEASKPLNEQLCHPLCSCDSCEKLLASKRNDPMAVTIFSRDDMGSTVLHAAAEFDQETLLFDLIKLGAVVNATNYHGSTPLHLACLRGHKKAAIMLIHYEGNINAKDNDGNTPIHLAAANGHDKVVEAMLLVDSHHTMQLKINAANEHGDTPLHIAARWGYSNLVEILIDHGASVEARNNNKETPIQCAANSKIQELLVQANTEEPQERNYIYVQPAESTDNISAMFSGEDVQSPQPSNASPMANRRQREFQSLLKVVSDGDIEMVKVKLGFSESDENADVTDFGTPEDSGLCHPLCQCPKCCGKQRQAISESLNQTVNMTNEDGVTCLHVASLYGYERIVALLLTRGGASPNCRTKVNLKTPLHLACQYNHSECVKLLLKHRAKPDFKDRSGCTPLHFCCSNGHIMPAILLLQNGANPNTANKRGNAPLHESARWNWPDLITLLLDRGASIEARNKSNLTPLQYAQHDEVMELLRNAETEQEEGNTKKEKQYHDRPSSRAGSFRNSQSTIFEDVLSDNDDVFETHRRHGSRHSIEGSSETGQHSVEGGGQLSRHRWATVPVKQRRSTLAALFQAYEEDDIEKLKQLTAGIKKFDRKKSLRRVNTIDKSEPFFDRHLVQMLSIQHFNPSSLRHVETPAHCDGESHESTPERHDTEDRSCSSSSDGYKLEFENEMGLMKRNEDDQTDFDNDQIDFEKYISASMIDQLSSDDSSSFKSVPNTETISDGFSPDLGPKNNDSQTFLDAVDVAGYIDPGAIAEDIAEDVQKLPEPRSDATDYRTLLDPTVNENYDDLGPTNQNSQIHPDLESSDKVSEMLLEAMKDISSADLGDSLIHEDCSKDEHAQDITQGLHQTDIIACTNGNQEQMPGVTPHADFGPSHDHDRDHLPLETINDCDQNATDCDQSLLEYDTDLSSSEDQLDKSTNEVDLSQKSKSNFDDCLLLENGSSKLETQVELQTYGNGNGNANGNVVDILNVYDSIEEATDMYASKDENYV